MRREGCPQRPRGSYGLKRRKFKSGVWINMPCRTDRIQEVIPAIFRGKQPKSTLDTKCSNPDVTWPFRLFFFRDKVDKVVLM